MKVKVAQLCLTLWDPMVYTVNKKKTRYLKLGNLTLFYVWEAAGIWAHWNMICQLSGAMTLCFHIQSFLKLHLREWLPSDGCLMAGSLLSPLRDHHCGNGGAIANDCDILCLWIWQAIFSQWIWNGFVYYPRINVMVIALCQIRYLFTLHLKPIWGALSFRTPLWCLPHPLQPWPSVF